MTYAIYQDLQKNTTEVKIHLKTCHHFRNYQQNPPTDTTTWHQVGQYETAKHLAEQLSKNTSKGWRNAKCCL